MTHGIAIAIDGPAGAGKSTVSSLLATKTGFQLLDTGAMYRALTWAWLNDARTQPDILPIHSAQSHVFSFEVRDGLTHVTSDSQEITQAIRSAEVTNNVSFVAAIPEIREIAVDLQRQYVDKNIKTGVGIIVEGRDIGSTVLPNADLKFFLTADAHQRAIRRALELGRDPKAVIDEINNRDEADSSREVSPLRVPEDAIVIDATHLTVDQVIEQMLHHIARVS